MISRRAFMIAMGANAIVAAAMSATAQSPPAFRVAWVSPDRAASPSPNLEAFRAALRDLGYVEGKNVVIDTWWGEGSAERIEQIAGDLVRSRPDVIVTGNGLAVGPLMRAGVKIPIVFVISADPVVAKIVDSFPRPGGNLTGISLLSVNLMPKRIELLKEAVPAIKRIAVLGNPQHAGVQVELEAANRAAARLGLATRYFPVYSEGEVEEALADIARGHDEAILVFADGFTLSFAGRIAAFSLAQRIPAVSGWKAFAERGNLMSYGPVIGDTYRRLATYVDKIHNGAKPGDLPVELPTKVELVINLKAASALGLTVPQSLLLRADDVIQ